MPDQNREDKKPSTVFGNIASLVGMYAVFVFLAGWTFLDYYYRSFGVYTRWIDIAISETLIKGFVILFQGAGWLWVVYLFVLVVPVLFEVFPKLQALVGAQIVAAVLMLCCLPLTYQIAKSAGTATAARNQNPSTTELAFVRFATKCGRFSGRLLHVKDGIFYIHDSKSDSKSEQKLHSEEACLELSPSNKDNHFVTIFRSEDVHVLEITER